MMTLKVARVQAGLSQEEAAKAIGVSAATLREYEHGRSFPTVPTLKRIEQAYAVRYDDLIFLDSEPIKSV